MKNTSVQTSKTLLLRVCGWLHATVLFWCFYPLAARICGLEGRSAVLFVLGGATLLFPVAASWYAVNRLKYLILYLLSGVFFSLAYGGAGELAGRVLGVRPYLAGGFFLLVSFGIFLIRAGMRIKKGKVQKELEELPTADLARVDYSGLDVPVFLDAPSFLHWLYLALHYLLGAGLKLSLYWHTVFYLFLADVFICFVYQFVDSFHSFLREHSSSANLPVRTMEKVVRIIFGIACVILLAFTLPSLLYGREPLSELTFQQREISGQWQMQTPAPVTGQTDMPDLQELLGGEAVKEPPRWLVFLSQMLIYLTFAGMVAAALVIIYRTCRNAGKFFASETEDDIRFLEKGFTDQNQALKKRRLPWSRNLSADLRIRKYYKKALRRGLKERPGGSETPHELENLAGLARNESRQVLHDCYEKARYSAEGCTAEEAGMIRRLSDL